MFKNKPRHARCKLVKAPCRSDRLAMTAAAGRRPCRAHSRTRRPRRGYCRRSTSPTSRLRRRCRARCRFSRTRRTWRRGITRSTRTTP